MKKQNKENQKLILYAGVRKLEGQDYNLEIALVEGKLLLTAASLVTSETIVINIPLEKSYYR